jgi:hypothetical protein
MAKRISRLASLTLLAGVPLAVAAAASSAAAADDSAGTKAQYKYVNHPGPKGAKCSGCVLFKPPAACSIVKGKIAANGYCIAYAAKAH